MNFRSVLSRFGGGSDGGGGNSSLAEIKKANGSQQGGEIRNRPQIGTGMRGTMSGSGWVAELLGFGSGRVTNWGHEVGLIDDNSIYSICRRFLAFETVKAALEAQVYEKSNDTWAVDSEHPAAALLQNPHPYMSISAIIGALTVDLARGNAFCQTAKTAAGRPAELWWLPRDCWTVWLESVEGVQYKRYQLIVPGGSIEHYWDITAPDISGDGTNSVIHFRSPDPEPGNFLLGRDPMPAQFRHLCIDNEGGQFSHTILKNIGVSGIALIWKDKETVPGDTAKQEIKRGWRANQTGENRGDISIFDSEVDLKEVGKSPQDMALTTILDRPERRIPAAIGLNAKALNIGSAEDNTFSNVEEARKSAWDNGIAPLHSIIADTLNHKLLPAFDRVPGGTRIIGGDGARRRYWFNYENVPDLQEDESDMHKRANQDFATGGVTVNEKRAALRLKPLEDGDPRGDLMAHELKAPGAAPDGQQQPPPPDGQQPGDGKKIWDESQHSRAADGEFGTGSHADTKFQAILTVAEKLSGITPAKAAAYRKVFEAAIATVPPACRERCASNLRAVKFYDSPQKLNGYLSYVKSGDIGGAWKDGILHLDGGLGSGEWSQQAIYHHEIAHAIDNSGQPGAISSTDAWREAWQSEIKGPRAICKYAGMSAAEGFAEFGRLMFSGKSLVNFPKCAAVWQAHGLLEGAATKAMGEGEGGSALPEIFSEPVELGGGGLADVLVSDSATGETSSMKTNDANVPDDMPAPLPDPHGMAFTDEELDALTDVDSPEAVKLAYGLSTDTKQALLGADVENNEI